MLSKSSNDHLILKKKIALDKKIKLLYKALNHIVKHRKLIYFNALLMETQIMCSEDSKKILKYRLVSKRAKIHSENYADILKASIKRTAASSLCHILERIFIEHSIGKQAYIFAAFNKLANVGFVLNQ